MTYLIYFVEKLEIEVQKVVSYWSDYCKRQIFRLTVETILSVGSYRTDSSSNDLIATSVIMPAVMPNKTPNVTSDWAELVSLPSPLENIK